MLGSAIIDRSARKSANAVWTLFSSAGSSAMNVDTLDRAAGISFFRTNRRWQVLLVLLHAVLMIGGLSRVHHLPNGKPSHPHSTDSVFAEMAEAEGEVGAESVFLAMASDLVNPTLEMSSAPLDTAPILYSEFQPLSSVLLRGPPVA